MKKNKQHGFGAVAVIIVLGIFGVIAFAGWTVTTKNEDSKDNKDAVVGTPTELRNETPAEIPKEFMWRQAAVGWEAMQKAPDCPAQPMLKAPTDLSKATSILYPGQTRGGNYKPHGGLRFDNSTDNKVVVTAPIDGFLVRGASYLAEGEVQYTFDVMNNCGVMYRVGHLREIPEKFQKIADTWPNPSESSATQSMNPPVYVKQGETLATKVGLLNSKNTFFDLGIFDYRQQNEASRSQAYQAAHGENNGKDIAWYAVCWLQGWLSNKDQAMLAALPPGDPTSGKSSDYCKQ